MSKIQFTGKQHTVTIPKDVMDRMGWKTGTDVYIGKDPNRDSLFVEEMGCKYNEI